MLQDRKGPIHVVHECPSRPTIIFLTICTRGRDPWLDSPLVHDAFKEVSADRSVYIVGKYVIMPEHVHLFVSPASRGSSPLSRWVGYWKSQMTRRIVAHGTGWQPEYWDWTLRSTENYARKWEYVEKNPERRGLVMSACEWPYMGEIYQLKW